jgi:hypothetical protein
VGKPAGVALDYFHVKSEELKMIDEPPGVLDAVSFRQKTVGGTKRVYLQLERNPALFSESRHWELEAIRNAKVVGRNLFLSYPRRRTSPAALLARTGEGIRPRP